mgnify:CR=1 FL=1|jgi:hypothetical protein
MKIYRCVFFWLMFICTASVKASTHAVPESTTYTYVIATCSGTQSACAWTGRNIVVMIEGETPASRNQVYMDSVLTWLDNMVDQYQQVTGLTSLPLLSSYQGKPVIEVVKDNCGAGGLASHGQLGMSTSTELFNTMYNGAAKGKRYINQVFLYETNRNYYLPAFNDKFDWAMNNDSQNWGWWTVAFNNANAVILTDMMGIELYYYGQNRAAFRQSMIKQLEAYWNGSTYTFENGWMQDRMPWDTFNSPNDLMSGLLIYSYENFGGKMFYKKLYGYLNDDMQGSIITNRSDVFAYQECRDNIYKIWSLSAGKNLITFFEKKMKWVISSAAKEWIANRQLSGIEKTSVQEDISYDAKNKQLLISGDAETPADVLCYDSVGRLSKTFKIGGSAKSIDLSCLPSGIYLIRCNKQVLKITMH